MFSPLIENQGFRERLKAVSLAYGLFGIIEGEGIIMAYDPLAALLAIDTKKKDTTEAADSSTGTSAAETFAAILKDAKTGKLPPLSAKKPEDTAGVYKVDLASKGFSLVKVAQPDGTNAMMLENVETGRTTNLKGFTSVSFSDGKEINLEAFASKVSGNLRGYNGGAEGDTIAGRDGITDALFGNEGDDKFSTLSNLDVVDGGAGEDTASLALAPSAYRIQQQAAADGTITYTVSWVEKGADGVEATQSISLTNVEKVSFATGGGADGKSAQTLTMAEFVAKAGGTA
jgi:hypothetical protein